MRLRLGRLGPEGSDFAKFFASAAVLATVLGGWLLTENLGAAKAEPVSLPDSIHHDGDCDLWFVGSSSIARWTTLGRDMVPWAAHNRGVPGSNFEEVRRRFAVEPMGRQPQAIILYAGENDIAFGALPAQVFASLEGFLAEKRRRYGSLPTLIISLKPTPMRQVDLLAQTIYNREVQRLTAASDDLVYVDIVSRLMINGHLGDYYDPDGLHLNRDGYRRWIEPVRQALRKAVDPRTLDRCMPAGDLDG